MEALLQSAAAQRSFPVENCTLLGSVDGDLVLEYLLIWIEMNRCFACWDLHIILYVSRNPCH
jgi:hypothetical protein